MGQGLEPLTADLCLSSRSQPPQLPSRTDFFEQSKKKNVFRASTVTTKATTTTTTTASNKTSKAGNTEAAQLLSPQQQLPLLLLLSQTPVKPLPARHRHQKTRTALTASSGRSCKGCNQSAPIRILHRTSDVATRVTTTTKPTAGKHRREHQHQKRRSWWPHQEPTGRDDTRSILSSMLPDFPSNANTMEFG